MTTPFNELAHRANQYATARGIQLERELGHGKDGTVYSTNVATALKVFVHSEAFERELACYLRLTERNVTEILGHFVPWLVHADHEHWILEITIVKQPFLLDFASVYLDWPPDFPPEVLELWEHEKQEQFGPNWSHVKLILKVLEDQYDIYLFDVHPGNITFDSIN